ncbi:MAG: ribulose-phosphate 3-epimerase [Egibacteraceae bacterium]
MSGAEQTASRPSHPTSDEAPQIAASVLGADYARFGEEVTELDEAGVDRIHFDIMDGHFVPDITFGADVVTRCRDHSALGFEAHLMVANPDDRIEEFAQICETVIVHVETCTHLHRTLGMVRSYGARAGAALNPSTPLSVVANVLDQVDLLLVMTVNPGFGGQDYLATMEPKIAAAWDMIVDAGVETVIEVDGGISSETVAGAVAAGARRLVAGSAILSHQDGRKAGVTALREALRG